MGKACQNYATAWQAADLLKKHFALLVAGVLFICALGLPATARAECGDYVVREAAALATPDTSPGQPRAPMSSGMPHKRCQGPHCSQSTPSEPVPITVIPPRAEQWGCIALETAVPSAPASAWLGKDSSQPSPLFVQAIYHPPRLLPLRLS